MLNATTHTPHETEAFAASIAPRLSPGDVIACRGGLGAGKTAFARGLARGLGLTDEVSSPTFALVHEYTKGNIPLYHFDMYRISDLDSLYSTGFYDYLDLDGVLLIEWSENVEAFLPEPRLTLTIEPLDEDTRSITLEGERF